MPIFYLDYENGNDNYSGTSFALLASAADGATTAGSNSVFGTFSSASANFLNNGTLAPTKNLAWYSNCLYLNSTASASFIEKSSITGPSGIDSTVYKLWEDSQNSYHWWQSITWYNPLSATTQYTISVYAKAAERTKVILRFDSDAKAARFNLSSGTIEQTGASATSAISSIGNGWYRISITVTSSGTADNVQIILVPNDNTGLTYATYNGDNNSGFYICGIQIEQASSVTTYEKPPEQYLSLFNGTSYIMYHIVQRLSSTSLRINQTPTSATAVSSQSSRQYYIGGRWKTFTSGALATRLASDDTVRIMSSPDPTSIGSATWVGSKMQATASISSSTNASPIVITTSSTMASLGISNGDTIVITGHTTNTNANGTWEVTNVSGSTCSLVGSTGNGVGSGGVLRKASNQRVILASSPILNIASHGNRGNGRTAWTAQTADITTSLVTTDAGGGFKEGDCSDSIAVGVNFTTGLAAYKATGTLNLSGYQQISFWIKQTAGTIGASGALSLKLCSDTAGATAVNTFNIENLTVLNRWTPITIDLATNLGSSIQSIGFYVNTDNGAQTFLLSNIIACKASSSADSLNLCSLIGKNTSGETWCGIQSINGTRVMLDTAGQSGPVNTTTPATIVVPGYYGTSETVTTYKRETIKVPLSSTTTGQVSLLNFQLGGRSPQSYGVGNPITYSFGWNRTDMSTRTGESWFDGRNGYGYGNYSYYLSGGTITVDRVSFVRFYYGLFLPGQVQSSVTNCHCNNCDQFGLYPRENRNFIYDTIYCCYNSAGGVFAFNQIGQTSFKNMVICSNAGPGIQYYNALSNSLDNFTIKNNSGAGIAIVQAHNLTANSGTISDNNTYGIDNNSLGHSNVFKNITLSTNTTASHRTNTGGPSYFINCALNDSTEIGIASPGYGSNSKVFSHNHDQTANLHYIWCDYGLIYSTTSVRYSNNGIAWAMAPTNVNIRYVNFPLDLSLATVAVSANSQVTVKAWMRRSAIGLIMRLRVKGGQIAGVTNDVTGYMTAAADTWEQVSLNFTPTEAGVVEILAECWGGSTFTGYVDDLTIIQI